MLRPYEYYSSSGYTATSKLGAASKGDLQLATNEHSQQALTTSQQPIRLAHAGSRDLSPTHRLIL